MVCPGSEPQHTRPDSQPPATAPACPAVLFLILLSGAAAKWATLSDAGDKGLATGQLALTSIVGVVMAGAVFANGVGIIRRFLVRRRLLLHRGASCRGASRASAGRLSAPWLAGKGLCSAAVPPAALAAAAASIHETLP